ncbi:toxic anion resistance protein, partial [Clostridium sardiniense]|uniref:toxic anion resistance protein n=1 Tax=Clostridium sardiniense TaxID=29369 RepID=UPI003D34E5C9
GNQNMMGNQNMVNNQNMTSNQNMMNNQNMMGNQNMMSNQNMMGNQGMMNGYGHQQTTQETNIMENAEAYKNRLRQLPEVQALTSEVEIANPNSIIQFGQQASSNISKVSDELLSSMKEVKSEEVSEMLVHLTKIMDKFDVKELEDIKEPSFIGKIFKAAQTSVAKLFQKYDTMGLEVEKVYVLLKRYESEIRESNNKLKRLYDGNIEFYQLLEKYIVAGEMAIEEINLYINQYEYNNQINQEEKQMMVQKLETAKEMLDQRVYDLRIAENVAIQAVPMIQNIQMSNFNLMRKINSSFIITLPIFKQCLAQAIILKRQEIQAKSIKQLDDKTNELIQRNAANTATQSANIARMASTSSISIETLEKSYNTIMKGIEETRAIQEANKQQRGQNVVKLESIKEDMKKTIKL